MKRKLPSSVYNPITLIGAGISSISFGLILFLMLLEFFEGHQKPYVGIIAFVILPAFLIFGLGLIIFGIIREHKLRKAGIVAERKFPQIDLNDPRHRKAVSIFLGGTIILLLFTAFGSFKAYEYTETDEFCGTVCHEVMEPEFTAYKYSPHARVGCVQCHIGPGTDWFVRSKLSGAYQVYSVLFDKYPRPIPTPIHNLRPAQETCEQCHWPQHFFSEKKRDFVYYHSDENNSKWTLTLLMKVGGGVPEAGVTEGIHWHMNIANEVTYISTDSSRMNIPWVKSKSRDGKETIYKSTESKLSDEELAGGIVRRMDCIDCHNRPSHIFNPGARSVNHVMGIGWIDPSLPFIKSVSVEALDKVYSTKETAADSIKIIVENFYNSNYPELAFSKADIIKNAIIELQKIYSRNYFPEMQVSWKKYPEQIGHMFSPGCFRCHDGKHVSDDGKILSKDCNVCHTILAQEFENKSIEFSLQGVEYKHPVDIGDEWRNVDCSSCHAGQ
jgi:hypothetical protein